MSTPLPTDSELEILDLLWRRGPSTVREVHGAIGPRRDVGYTTVLKLLQIMLGKGLVQRDESDRSHVYRAVDSRRDTQRLLLDDLAERAFGGSSASLALRALANEPASEAELAELRAMLAKLEGRGGGE